MSVFNDECERLLRENSSAVDSVCLNATNPQQAERLGEALRGNTHVKALTLHLNRIDEGEDDTLLLQFIGESESLENLFLLEAEGGFTARTGLFLQAAGGSSAIKTIALFDCSVPVEAFASVMRTTSSIEYLVLGGRLSFVQGPIQPNGAAVDKQLAAAFASNRTLKRLTFSTSVSQAFSQAVMISISNNPILQDLRIRCSLVYRIADRILHLQSALGALGDLFRSCGSNFQKVTFWAFNWTEDSFRTIATSLQTSATVNVISFQSCRFDGPSSKHLCSIFQSKPMRRTLIVDGNVIFPEESGNVLADLVRTGEGLLELNLRGRTGWANDNSDFKAIMSALKESTSAVESILLGPLAPAKCELLMQSLPAFRNLRSIQFSLDQHSSHLKVRLLSAFQRNGSLTDIQVEARFLNNNDRDLLRRITDRNKKLPLLIASTPESSGTSIALWPRMFETSLASVEGRGPKDAFSALLGLGDRVGTDEVGSVDYLPPRKPKTG